MKKLFAVFSFALLIAGFSSCKKEEVSPTTNSDRNMLIPLDTTLSQFPLASFGGKYFINSKVHCNGDACHDGGDYNANGNVDITTIGDSIKLSGIFEEKLAYAGYNKSAARFHYTYYTGYAYLDTFYYRDKCDAYFSYKGDSIYVTKVSNHDGMCSSWASGSKIY